MSENHCVPIQLRYEDNICSFMMRRCAHEDKDDDDDDDDDDDEPSVSISDRNSASPLVVVMIARC